MTPVGQQVLKAASTPFVQVTSHRVATSRAEAFIPKRHREQVKDSLATLVEAVVSVRHQCPEA